MTEIMPVPRNSHITVLRPPSIRHSFVCTACLEAIRAADLSLPPLPDDAGLREG